MDKQFEIKVPRYSTGLRIKHYKALTDVGNVIDGSLDSRAAFIAEFGGVPLYYVRLLTKKDVDKIYTQVVKCFGGMKVGDEPAQEITINGKEYELIDPKTVGTGWHIDLSTCNIDTDPVRLACMYYFPKGERYGEVDENENLKHPINERYEDFQEHMNLKTFIDANTFFLQWSLVSTKKYMENEIVKEKTIQMLKRIPLLGRRLSTSSVKNLT